MRVHRFHQAEGIDVLFQIDMAAHAKRVDACVCASCAVEHGCLASDTANRFLDRLLDAWPVLLALEPLKRAFRQIRW